MNNLRSVLENLKSDKVKDRQEGLSAIRTIFSQDRVVNSFHVNRDGSSDPRTWLSVFQALFTAVLTEKMACTKRGSTKTTATAEKRAAEAASVVRWLTERTVTVMNTRVAKALLDHLTQIMVHKNALFMPVALDYIKALKCLVGYTPHLEHLEDDMWVKLVEMGFNVVLGDPVRTVFWDDEMSVDAGVENIHEELYQGDDDEEALSPTRKRRRPRAETENTQPSTSKTSGKWNRRIVPVTLEQIEFTSLLAILLRSPSAPFLSYRYDENDDGNHFAMSILDRLRRFLDLYPSESSLLHDFLSILSATLSHLTLNKRQEVEEFAHATWDVLVGFWDVKDKRLKEGVIVVLRVLFHYITSENSFSQNLKSNDCIDGIKHLWNLLDAEADSRWGVDGLSFDSLRLELQDDRKGDGRTELGAFVTKTFRAGWHFDPSQALSWAVLELQADCASKLYHYSESMQTSGTPSTNRTQGKRAKLEKLENPINSLLTSVRMSTSSAVRIYHLQALLFFIERFWGILHLSLRQEVLDTLLQFISYEDGGIQSWVLLCMASVAYAEVNQGSFARSSMAILLMTVYSSCVSQTVDTSFDPGVWDTIWSHAIRRVNVPLVSRAACHTAHVLLSLATRSGGSLQLSLSNQHILNEVETLVKDIDVQGPLYPYDSVCTFLAHCLRVASQDVKLYRMHLEEKVLSWLIDNWKTTSASKGRMPLHQVPDILLLLECICGFNRKTDITSQLLLPDCLVVHTLIEERRISPIRDFLLHAEVPRFQDATSNANEYAPVLLLEGDLVQPKGRERKVSTFFQRSLEALAMEWDLMTEDYGRLTAEVARRSLDLAVAALIFEALLITNGVNPNRRVTQVAARLVTSITRALKEAPWTTAEKALVSLGLEPLVSTETDDNGHVPWQVMLPPNNGTGIRKHILHQLTSREVKLQERRNVARTDFLRVIWQITDVQEQFLGDAMRALRGLLYDIAGGTSDGAHPRSPRAMDDRDDFEPTGAISTRKAGGAMKYRDEEYYLRYTLGICIGFLTVGPFLQSTAGEPTRDKELISFILTLAERNSDCFLALSPILLVKVRQRVLHLGVKALDALLDQLSKLLVTYAHSKSGGLQVLVIKVLHSTMDVWLCHQASPNEVGEKIQQMCDWLSRALRKKKIGSWLTRDALSLFLDEYLKRDPEQAVWSLSGDNEDSQDMNQHKEGLPTALLMLLNSDEDIRVRFRMATVISRLFSAARSINRDPMIVYDELRRYFTIKLERFEFMLTRTLALGNIMVISSEVRRGAYWHLLETCFFVDRYHPYIRSILNGVSQRMGLARISKLFDAYASQLAFSICKINETIHRLPPNLLGYRDRLECAEKTFLSFAPSAIVENPQLFDKHCSVLHKTLEQGIKECFADIVGLLTVMWLSESSTEGLESHLKEHTTMDDDKFAITFSFNVDRVIVSLLKCLGDQDVPYIVTALAKADPASGSATVFEKMTRFRTVDDFRTHIPNLPAHPTAVILKALGWIASRFPEASERATTYHVMHQIFADIQSSPLVNEQYRLANALTLWIALHHATFKDPILLHSFIHGAVSVLAQSDLARVAQSWLDWAFHRYIKERLKDRRLSNVLVQIACHANKHAQNSQEPTIATMGSDILRWIDKQVLHFEESDAKNTRPVFRSQILRALPTWSHSYSRSIAALSKNIDAEALSSLLNDNRDLANQFRVVRRLREQITIEGSGKDHFERNDFWRLKETIPPENDLHVEDAEAFADLLYLHKGRINSLGTEQPASNSLRHLHWSSARQGATTDGDITAARDSIVQALLIMLDGDEATQVHLAYTTLRLIMSIVPAEAFSFNSWHSEVKDELELLRRYKWTPRDRSPRYLSELQTSDTFIRSASQFSHWVSALTILLADSLATSDAFFAQLTSVLESDVSFAEQGLPVLVHRLLRSELNDAVQTAKGLLSHYFTKILTADDVDSSCIRAIVDVVLHLRRFSSKTNDALAYNKWLDIDYSLLAKSALKCGAYTTALLFLELAFEFKINTREEGSAEEILYEIYSHIDEPDGFYGIKPHNLRRFLIKRFHHEKQWNKAFQFHGAALQAGSKEYDEAEGLLEVFHAFGFDQLAIDTLRSSSILTSDHSKVSHMNYELGWRTETWDLPEKAENTTGASLYRALRCIYRERDTKVVDRIVSASLTSEIARLRYLGTENLAEIRQINRDIMCLGEIFRWRNPDIQDRLARQQTDVKFWNDFASIPEGFDFRDLESILTTRRALVRSARQKEERQQIGRMTTPFTQSLIDLEKRCLIRLSEAARGDGQVQIALNAIIRAQRLEDKEATSFNISQEFANVLWHQKEDKPATEFLQDLLARTPENTVENDHRASLLAQLGVWTSDACLEKPIDIRDRFFEPAIDILQQEGTKACRSRAAVYYQYAVFSDRQYHAILQSPDAIRWKVYVQRKTQEIQRREQELSRTQNLSRAGSLRQDQVRAKKLLEEDSELFRKHNLARDTFLKQAIEMYSRCLESSDDFDNDAVIRLCSLWFANFDDEQGLQECARDALERIPSRKMIFLSHQLSARLSKPPAGRIPCNQANLQQLVLRMCKEHPFHSLYQVYCLHPDRSIAPASKRQAARLSASETQTDRMAAADDIFEKLKQDETSSSRVRDVEVVCNACLEWAKYPIKNDNRYKNRKASLAFKIPEDVMLRNILNVRVPVPTYHTPIDATLKYDNCVWIERYDTTFQTAGGINLPKISICYGSDGQRYKQLFKGEGNDDLRQDAVMEQVFDLVNHVLHCDKETRRRRLKIRGYKVLPLSSQAGLIEFVDHTSPLREWLVSAHDRYHPKDLKYKDIRESFDIAQREWRNSRVPVDTLVARYGELTDRFLPVMRHFFTERQRIPVAWFTTRLNYARSVASSSVIGHVLGLGDRHTSNILMDIRSGEVVHIDLGIAFDQGKLLPVPERVPFRLTRDVVDGMGSSGTQGVFQRCAEETLRVLRENSEVIMTILEVFKHDPLHSWTASEIKLKQVQQDTPIQNPLLGAPTDTSRLGFGIGIDLSSGTAEEAADRALSSVARKLDKSLSVQCTVNELISEAADAVNLATMYSGWAPYL